jgi:hypothetical protein
MSVSAVNLTIVKGTDFEASFFITSDDNDKLNLSFSQGTSKIKKHPTSNKFHNFDVVLYPNDGEISISMGRTVTSQLTSGRNYFDIFIENTELDFVSRVVTGTIIVEDTTI